MRSLFVCLNYSCHSDPSRGEASTNMVYSSPMKIISIVTTNPVKHEIALSYAKAYDISIEMVDMETPEIQSLLVTEIAEYSAKYAAEKLQKPVLATDAGMYIKALNGFPGPFIKYSNHFFSSADYLKLMEGKVDRSLEWVEGIAYCEPGIKPVSVSNIVKGSLAIIADGNAPGRAIQEIFIPEGKDKVGSLISQEEMTQFWIEHVIAWEELFSKLEQLKLIKKIAPCSNT
jgi:XTP/dITP diphosphohydrolase